MKNNRMNVLSAAVVSAIAIGTLGFAGCKSKPPSNEPTLPPPAMQPAASQPAVAPAPAIAPTPAIPEFKAEPVKYTVVKGDSFSKIAKNHGVGMKELAAYNNMSLEKPLQIGKVLNIPAKAAK